MDEIPPPEQVTFDPSSKTVVFTAGPSCLSLVGVAEGLGPSGGWMVCVYFFSFLFKKVLTDYRRWEPGYNVLAMEQFEDNT